METIFRKHFVHPVPLQYNSCHVSCPVMCKVHRRHCYQGWTGGGEHETDLGLHRLVQLQPPTPQYRQDQGDGGGLQEAQASW